MEGYTLLGKRMGDHSGLAIFRRFAALNNQNLLYMQAELVTLEADLRSIELSNSSSENEACTLYARDWRILEQAQQIEGKDQTQWQLFDQIRLKLKLYSKIDPAWAVNSKVERYLNLRTFPDCKLYLNCRS